MRKPRSSTAKAVLRRVFVPTGNFPGGSVDHELLTSKCPKGFNPDVTRCKGSCQYQYQPY